MPQLLSFVGKRIAIRRADGSMITTGVSPFPAALHEFVEKSKWDHALKLCRHVKVSHHSPHNFLQ